MLASDVDRYQVIDTDTHVIEPYDLWTSRLSTARWGDRLPQVHWDPNMEEDAWYFGGSRIGPAAGAAQAGWNAWPPDHPPKLDLVDEATWDAASRLRRMDEYGIWAQVLYPNVAGFGAGKLLTIGDPELMLALCAGVQRLPRRLRIRRSPAVCADHGIDPAPEGVPYGSDSTKMVACGIETVIASSRA